MVSHDTTFEDVGTFAWRYARYEMVLSDLTGHSFGRLMIGSGTSSAASLLIESDFYQEENVDPNRLVHDEFLRSFYEWGLPGLLLLILFLVEAIKTCLKMIAQDGPLEAWAFLAVFVPLLITLTVENILADSGSPGGVGYNLVLTAMVAVGSARLLPRSCERVR